MAKTTLVVASYSGLYEGDGEYINGPDHPPNGRGGANQRPTEVAHVVPYIGWKVGGWAVQKYMEFGLLSFKLAVMLRKLAKHS